MSRRTIRTGLGPRTYSLFSYHVSRWMFVFVGFCEGVEMLSKSTNP